MNRKWDRKIMFKNFKWPPYKILIVHKLTERHVRILEGAVLRLSMIDETGLIYRTFDRRFGKSGQKVHLARWLPTQ